MNKELTSNRISVQFNPTKKIVSTDASPYGISTISSHVDENNLDRPVCYASRTLTPAEKNYAHMAKEGLAVVFGARRYYEYLYGQKFLLQTDNSALSCIFHPEKSIPEIAAARLQRWTIFLSPF